MEVTRGNGNTVSKNQLEKAIKDVLGDLSSSIAHTLGPCGANTLVMEPYASTPITPSKDGYRLMLNYRYDNIVYECIYRIVRDISSRMNQEVGDGTTTGIIIANALYTNILKYIKKQNSFVNKLFKNNYTITPYGVDSILKEVETILKKYLINNYTIPISGLSNDEKLSIYKKVAAVSANNDPEIGDLIANVYGKTNSVYTFIDTTRSETEDTIVADDLGFEFPAGHITRHMATESDGITCEYQDPLFLLIDGPLIDNDLPSLQPFIMTTTVENQRPLVIMASEFTNEVVNYFIQLRSGIQVGDSLYRVPIVAITVNTASELGNERLRDLEAALGAKALPTKNGKLINPPTEYLKIMSYLGRAKKIKTAPYWCRINEAGGEKSEIEGRVAEIEGELKKKNDMGQDSLVGFERIETLKRRIAMLRGEMVNIKVGGVNYKEKESRRLLVEDAVYAVKATISNGITVGGNTAVVICIKDHIEEITNEITDNVIKSNKGIILGSNVNDIKRAVRDLLFTVSDSFTAAYKKVLFNAFLNKSKVEKIYKKIENYKTDYVINKNTGKLIKVAAGSPVKTYNLITGEYEGLSLNTKLIVPGNTDYELMRSVFGVIRVFITSNQMMSYHMPAAKK